MTIETLLGLVNVGTAALANPKKPLCWKEAIVGSNPSLTPCSI